MIWARCLIAPEGTAFPWWLASKTENAEATVRQDLGSLPFIGSDVGGGGSDEDSAADAWLDNAIGCIRQATHITSNGALRESVGGNNGSVRPTMHRRVWAATTFVNTVKTPLLVYQPVQLVGNIA
jgi:hypothetical protein